MTTRFSGTEWTFDDLQALHDCAAEHFDALFGLPTFPNQLEVVCAEQMLDAYATVGLPVQYPHWSFGKHYVASRRGYEAGQSALAYEIVLNTNPAIAYLMETNTLAMQALVIAHACFGHNAVFANNYLFRERTHADAILDYCVFARDYVRACEERHGIERVEATLDAAHALSDHAVDRYLRPARLDSRRERDAQAERLREAQAMAAMNELAQLVPQAAPSAAALAPRFPAEPQENLLYFIEKHSPGLEPWQRELVRIVRKFAEYFHPQRLTKVLNEGFASYTHYTVLHAMHRSGQVSDAMLIEAMESHTSVVRQPAFGAFNPYALGFAIFRDIERMCTAPTDEDRRCMPHVAGRDLRETLAHAVRDHRDDSFILQFLGPRVVRDMGMCTLSTAEDDEAWRVDAVQDDHGWRLVRSRLAAAQALERQVPAIEVFDYARKGSRSLTLRHRAEGGQKLDSEAAFKVLRHVKRLWGNGFEVRLTQADEDTPAQAPGAVLLTV